MPWHQVSTSGRYERDFDSIEKFYRVIADAGAPLRKQHYLISAVVQLQSLPPVTDVQQAWKALRREYPQIAGMPDETGTRFTYSTPTSADFQEWASQTFVVASPDTSANELYETQEPSSLFILYYLPGTRELVFRTPHWRIDGMGMLDFQSAFLRILSNTSSNTTAEDVHVNGSEAVRLVTALDEAASVPQEVTPSMQDAVRKELSVFIDNMGDAISIATLPNVLPTTPKRLISAFSVDTSRQIFSACKARGITVTTAAHAALVLATLPHVQHKFDAATRGQPGGKYLGFNVNDLRKYLPAPYNGPDAAVSVYHTGMPVYVDLDKNRSFDTIAATLGKTYKRTLNRDEPRNMFEFLTEYVNQILASFSVQPEDPLKAPAHPELSSFGVVNDHLQAEYDGKVRTVVVESWWVAVEVINRLLLTNVWTWSGELQFSVNWNEAFYQTSFVEDFLEAWKEVLVKELGVDIQ